MFLNIFNHCNFILSAYMHCQVTCRRWLQLTLHTIRPGLALGLPSKITGFKDMCNCGNSTSFLFISMDCKRKHDLSYHNRLSLQKFCCYEHNVIYCRVRLQWRSLIPVMTDLLPNSTTRGSRDREVSITFPSINRPCAGPEKWCCRSNAFIFM